MSHITKQGSSVYVLDVKRTHISDGRAVLRLNDGSVLNQFQTVGALISMAVVWSIVAYLWFSCVLLSHLLCFISVLIICVSL